VLDHLSEHDKDMIFRRTAARVYRIPGAIDLGTAAENAGGKGARLVQSAGR
jgi:hypothetical protein